MKKRKCYIYAAIITMIIFIILMLFKGISPFSNTLVGTARFDEEYIPLLYRLHDVLMGNESLFYDFKVGMGSNIFLSLIEYGMFNPLIIITGLFSKSIIPNILYFVILLKLGLMTISFMYISKNIFKNIDEKMLIITSVTYSLSGYVLLLYSNINYLDIGFTLPLIILGLYKLLNNNDSRIFISGLVLSFIFNVYSSLYISFYLSVFVIIYSLIFKNKVFIINTIKYYFISVLLCSFIIIPCLLNGISVNFNALNNINEKLIYLFPSSLFIILFIKRLFVKDKYSLMYLICLLFVLVLLPFKSIILGNISVTYESGIIIIMLFYVGGLHYLNKEDIIFKKSISDNIFYISYIVLLICLIYVGYNFRNVILDTNFSLHIEYAKQVVALFIMFLVAILLNIISLHKYNEKVYLFISNIIIILIFGFYYVSVNDVSIVNSNNKIELDSYNIFGYKDNTASLGGNFALINNVSSVSYFNNSGYKFYEKLGYTSSGNSIYNGGTIFSDLLTGSKYILSYDELDSSLYYLVKEENDIYYYELKYDINYVFEYDNNLESKFTNTLLYQNNIYKKLFDKDDDLINIVSPNVMLENVKVSDNFLYSETSDGKLKFTIELDETSMVYLNLESSYGQVYGIKVNGKQIKNPIYSNRHNTKYPASNQTILYLGEYEKGTIDIEMGTEYILVDNFNIGIIPISKMEDIYYRNDFNVKYIDNTISIKGSSSYSKLLIPINYNKNLVITNDGKKISYEKVLDNYVSISLDSSNDIVIEYRDDSILLGIFMSIVCFSILYIHKKENYML